MRMYRPSTTACGESLEALAGSLSACRTIAHAVGHMAMCPRAPVHAPCACMRTARVMRAAGS